MLHARLFVESQKYRDTHFQPIREQLKDATPASESSTTTPWLDGNPAIDRPLFVQFCANDPDALLAAARIVAPYCDAVDLNLGCPQGIARKGHYGAFLQEDQDLIYRMINTLHTADDLPVPVTAKIRILDTREDTLAYARNVLRAGASILAVHGRRREQKGHMTGLADWAVIRYLRENLPPETVLFANGNLLRHCDLERCLAATGADAVLSAEGNLSDPALFAPPVPFSRGVDMVAGVDASASFSDREYWHGKDGRWGGWRVDAIFRRYLDILHRYVLDRDPPSRRTLFVPGDDTEWLEAGTKAPIGDGRGDAEAEQPARKKRKRDGNGGSGAASSQKSPSSSLSSSSSPNMTAAQAHLFHLLRHFVTRHTDVRDMLARARSGQIDVLEKILDAVERRVAEGLLEYERTDGASFESVDAKRDERGGENGNAKRDEQGRRANEEAEEGGGLDNTESSVSTVRECRQPWWIAQPIIRPLPQEAIAKGAVTLKKKGKGEGEKGLKNKKANGEEAKTVSPGGRIASVNGDKDSDPAAPLERQTSFPQSELVGG